jgi:hypothetical protein
MEFHMTHRLPSLRFALAGAALILGFVGAAPDLHAADKTDQAKDGVRPEIGKPLQEAQDALKQQNWSLALSKLAEADAVKDKTAYETYIVSRMRGVAANGAGDPATAATAFAAAIDSGKMPADEQLSLIIAVQDLYSKQKDYPNAVLWAQRYFKAGGQDQRMRTNLTGAEFNVGDFAAAARDAEASIAATEQAGQKPAEVLLTLLGNCYIKQHDDAAYVTVLEKFVTYYPKKEYWADLISHVAHKPGFSDRLVLNANRLQHATGSLGTADQYKGMVELDLADGISSEAKVIADEGAAAGLVPKALQGKAAAAAAADHKTLDRDEKDAVGNKDGNVLVSIGYTHIGFGEFQKGIVAMEQGIAKGGLKHPDEAKLELGIGYLQAGQPAKAIETFNTVSNAGGAADLAHLWVLRAKQGA